MPLHLYLLFLRIEIANKVVSVSQRPSSFLGSPLTRETPGITLSTPHLPLRCLRPPEVKIIPQFP